MISGFDKVVSRLRGFAFQRLFMQLFATIVSIYVRGTFHAAKCSTWLGWALEGDRKDGIVQNTS